MLTVGEFSRRCRLPVSTLHHYHDVGLLVPADVNPRTGYRYYDHDQLDVAGRIAAMRSVGLDLAQIGALIDADGSPDSPAWLEVRASLAAAVSDSQRRLRRFDQLMSGTHSPSHMSMPRRHDLTTCWAVTKEVTASSENIERTVRRGLAQLRPTVAPPGRVAATFPLDLDTDEIVIELHVEHTPCAATPDIVSVLSLIHEGPHDELWSAYRRLLDEAAQQGLRPTGHITERYGEPVDGRASTEVMLHIQKEKT